MHIREVVLEDMPSLMPLMVDLGYPTTLSELYQRFERLLSMSDYQTFIAEDNGEVIGFVGVVKQYAYEFTEPYARVLALSVSQHVRRQKVGERLMLAVERWAFAQGCTTVTLNSGNREERIAAHKFYEQLGYQGKSTGFSKRLQGL